MTQTQIAPPIAPEQVAAQPMPPRRRRLAPGEAISCPFTVLVDQREQAAFPFSGLTADASKNERPIAVTTRPAFLKTGDYSLEIIGHDGVPRSMDRRIVIERKSVEDLFGSVGRGRDRFEAEHERMAEIVAAGGHAFVVIEGSWERIVARPPPQCQLSPKTVWRTYLSWSQKYRVHWCAPGGRRMAEIFTFRALEKFYERWIAAEKHGKP